jgi:hypothetical protein
MAGASQEFSDRALIDAGLHQIDADLRETTKCRRHRIVINEMTTCSSLRSDFELGAFGFIRLTPGHLWHVQSRGHARAKAVIDFIEKLTVPSGHGAGEHFKLQPWQKAFIRDIYEPHRDGRRVVRRADSADETDERDPPPRLN